MVYNVLPFFDENDLLDLRLHVMGEVVDRFLVTESAWDFRGNYKGLKFDSNRFADWQSRLEYQPILSEHVPVSEQDPDNSAQTWLRERRQREESLTFLGPLNDGDKVLFTDADEILTPASIRAYDPDDGVMRADLQETIFYLNCLYPRRIRPLTFFPGAVVNATSPFELRLEDCQADGVMEGSGWHFRFLFPIEDLRCRLSSFSYWDYQFRYPPLKLIHQGWVPRHLVESPAGLVPLNGRLPSYVQQYEGYLLGKELIG